MNFQTALVTALVFYLVNGAPNKFRSPIYSTAYIKNTSNALVRAAEDIFINFYSQYRSTVYVFRESSTEQNYILDSDIISEFLKATKYKTVINLENEEELEMVEKKRIFNIMFVDNYDSFYEIYEKIIPEQFDFQGFYLVIITQPINEPYHRIQQIFEDLWGHYIVNVNVLIKNSPKLNEAFMYTFFPYTRHHCGKVRPIILGRYNENGSIYDYKFFPKKVRSLFNCPLNVAVIKAEPFMFVHKLDLDKIEIDGVDSILLDYIAKKMRFKPILKEAVRGVIYKNGTTTGAVRMIQDLDANITIGLFTKSAARDKLMTSSYYYYTSKILFIVPEGRPYSSFEKLFKPFKYKLWTVASTLFMFSCMLIAFWRWRLSYAWDFAFGKHMRTPYLDLFNILFGGSIMTEPLKNFSRLLLMIYLLYALVIRSAYQGALFQFLQSDTHAPQLETIDEMIQNDFKFYMSEGGRNILNEFPAVQNRAVVFTPKERLHYLEEIKDPSFKGAIMTTHNSIDYMNIKNIGKYFYQRSTEVVYNLHLCMYMHKPTPLREEINELILDAVSFGLVRHWVAIYSKRGYSKAKSGKKEPKPLNNLHLLGGYQIYFGGLLIAFIVFIFELLARKIKCLRHIFNYISE